MIRCVWCRSKTAPAAVCADCGGPNSDVRLPGPGQAPDPPARDLPRGFRRRLRFLQNPYVLVGFCCGTTGKLVTAGSVLLGGVNGLSWLVGAAGGLGLCLMTIGPSLWAIGLAWSEKQIHLLRHGLVASGEVTATGEAQGGRQSFWVEYRYEVAGQQYRRTLRDLGAWVSGLEPGRPVHVLYRKKKPHQSTTWPPLGREPVRFNLSHLLEERKKARELKASRTG